MRNPIKWLMILMIRGYQRFLGPLLPPVCRFEPSCSRYFVEALQKRGVIVGTALGTWRLLRCNPFCRGGYDPVPCRHEPTRLSSSERQPALSGKAESPSVREGPPVGEGEEET